MVKKLRFHHQEGLFSAQELHPYTELDAAREKALKCTRCRLHETRNNVVFGTGKTDKPKIFFVGEAPGATDDHLGEPMQGALQKVLKGYLKYLDMTLEDVYIANMVCCRPPGNRKPQDDEVAACMEYLLRQIRCTDPSVIVILGSTAANAMLRKKKADDEDKPVSSFRGKWYTWEDKPLRVTYHPSYMLIADPVDRARAKPEVVEDMMMIKSKLYLADNNV